MKLITSIQKELKSQKFFRDSWLVGLCVVLLIGIAFLLIWSFTHIKSADIEVPIRFTSLTNFDELGRWYQLYEIGAIAIIISLVNLFFAIVLHKKNRILSIFLIITAIMVVILSIAILLGFTSINYGS